MEALTCQKLSTCVVGTRVSDRVFLSLPTYVGLCENGNAYRQQDAHITAFIVVANAVCSPPTALQHKPPPHCTLFVTMAREVPTLYHEYTILTHRRT